MKHDYFVGTYSNIGIYKLGFDGKTFNQLASQNKFENCSYLCNGFDRLYGIVENSKNPAYATGYTFSMDKNLKLESSSPIQGEGPCHILLDSSRNLLYVASGSGSIDVLSLNPDKTINKLIYHKDYTKDSRMHYAALSNDNNYLFLINFCDAKLFAYKILWENEKFDLELITSYSFPSRLWSKTFVCSK